MIAIIHPGHILLNPVDQQKVLKNGFRTYNWLNDLMTAFKNIIDSMPRFNDFFLMQILDLLNLLFQAKTIAIIHLRHIPLNPVELNEILMSHHHLRKISNLQVFQRQALPMLTMVH
jgi:hypothetical protein